MSVRLGRAEAWPVRPNFSGGLPRQQTAVHCIVLRNTEEDWYLALMYGNWIYVLPNNHIFRVVLTILLVRFMLCSEVVLFTVFCGFTVLLFLYG